MKKLIFISAVSMLLFSGCLSSKKISEKTTTTKEIEKIEVKTDSVSSKEINQEIRDRIVINVPETDNEEVLKMFDMLLMQMNTSKSSGSNSYSSRYDKDTRQLVIDFIVAQTENTKTSVSSDVNTEKSFERNTDEYIYKKITTIPWWGWALLAYFFRGHIFGALGFFFPGISAIKTFSDLRKKKRSNN